MPLSSNTIIHLTREKASLQGILEDNFRLHYCKETVQLDSDSYEMRVPMVSFCDIPLSEIKDHIEKYGCYGIGLTKAWAVRNGLNPVLYVEPSSMLARSYNSAFATLVVNVEDDNFTQVQQSFTDVLRYIKNYQGPLSRKGKLIDEYRFSDEREWRYVPAPSEQCEMLMTDEQYLREHTAAQLSLEPLRLHFEPNDIKYIIIQSDSEISEFVHLLRHAKGNKYAYDDVERLMTRILTTEQIKGDI